MHKKYKKPTWWNTRTKHGVFGLLKNYRKEKQHSRRQHQNKKSYEETQKREQFEFCSEEEKQAFIMKFQNKIKNKTHFIVSDTNGVF